MHSTCVDIKKTIRGSVPRIPFEELAASVLGNTYELSLVICGDYLARRMNRQYRKKAYSPNVLSFPLEKNEGEIFLNIRKAEREARAFETTLRARLALLYVHGLYHLKGLSHGNAMEAAERATLKKFGLA
jgi:rRNA maturation RNase YbeY